MTASRAPSRGEGDRGAVLVLAGAAMFGLILISGLAVDVGAAYSARRQDQSAADTASLALAIDLRQSDDELVQMARDVVNNTVNETLTVEDFDTCPADPDALAYVLPNANCISLNQQRSQARVQLPTRQYDTIFAGMVGVDTFSHQAVATSDLQPVGYGGVLPFGLLAGSVGASGHGCIKTGPSAVAVDACTGPENGNFGAVNLGWHGNTFLGTPVDCDGGGTTVPDGRYIQSIAIGADHPLSLQGRAPHFGSQVVETYGCPKERPNAALTLTGNQPSALGAGLFAHCCFIDGGPGRLQRVTELLEYGSTASVSGRAVDDNPLWEFIDASVDSFTMNLPASCERDQFVGLHGGLDEDGDGVMLNLPAAVQAYFATASPAISKADRMMKLLERCFTHYNGADWNDNGRMATPDPPVGCASACSDPVFTRNSSSADRPDLVDIQYTSRFGYVPGLAQNTWPSGTAIVDFATTYPIFLQRICIGNNASNCKVFDPGVGMTVGGHDGRANSVTVFVFNRSMLPNGLGDEEAFSTVGLNVFPRLVE